jgi:colicin import membrane protein
LARAREEYRYTREYAIDTAAQQAGLSDEEREAAERAASGEPEDDGIEVVEVNADEQQRLMDLINNQRAEEQRIKEERVAAAEAELKAAQEEAARQEAAAAAAAEEARKAAEEKAQADALFALLEEQAASEPAASRRRLEDRPDPLTMPFCMGEFVQGIFAQDCQDFARAQKEAKDEAAAAADAAQKAAEAEKKAAEDAAAAAEDAKFSAFTDPVNTGGTSVADSIKEIEEQIVIKKMEKNREKDEKKLAAINKTLGELKFSLGLMEQTLADAKAAEREANPELAAQEELAKEIALQKKEEAERLPDDQRNELI